MNTSRLNHIQNWPELARQANWSVAGLVGLCGVSERTLRRYVRKNTGQAPKAWLAGLRHKQATELLLVGSSVKKTASESGYQNPETFSREFKKLCGKSPYEIARSSTGAPTPSRLAEKAIKWPEKLCHFSSIATKT